MKMENVKSLNGGADVDRMGRYLRIVIAGMGCEEFTAAGIRSACPEINAQLAARVLRLLERDGILQRFGPRSKSMFRWLRNRAEFDAEQWVASKICGDQITRSPKDERPRERLLRHGAAALRTADLLAILVRSGRGGDSALRAGEKIAVQYAGRLERLADAGRGELKAISPAVGETAYCQILAGIELGRRVADKVANREQPVRIKTSADAMLFCRNRFARLATDGAQEEFHIITLDTKNHAIQTHPVSVGLLDQAVVHPREVFRPAIKDAAKSVILVHNHPSGDPTPSEEDRALTERLTEAGRTLGISVLDHIVVARGGTVSIRDGKKFPTDES